MPNKETQISSNLDEMYLNSSNILKNNNTYHPTKNNCSIN